MKNVILAAMLTVLFTVACQEQGPTEAVNKAAYVPTLDASEEHPPHAYITDATCGLFDGDGNGVGGIPAKSVITQSRNGNAHHICHADVPNNSGKAVHYSAYNNPFFDIIGPVPCGIWDGTGFIITFEWKETVSASGQAKLICHAP